MTALTRKHQPTAAEAAQFITPSEWVVLSRDASALALDGHWRELRPDRGTGVWTDDLSNLLGVLW